MDELLDSPKIGFGRPKMLHNFSYGAFGEGGEAGFAFTGRWGGIANNNGGVLNWNRWYSQNVGRAISRDPIGVDGGENYYAFSRNSAVNFLDTSGLKPVAWGPPKSGDNVSCEVDICRRYSDAMQDAVDKCKNSPDVLPAERNSCSNAVVKFMRDNHGLGYALGFCNSPNQPSFNWCGSNGKCVKLDLGSGKARTYTPPKSDPAPAKPPRVKPGSPTAR